MPFGRCLRCGRPWTAGEVTGLGVLRPRSERAGGPLVEFACPACGAVHHLVPHGRGRYAVIGEPPPPEPSAHDRRVPWRRDAEPTTKPSRRRAPEPARAPAASREVPSRPSREAGARPQLASARDDAPRRGPIAPAGAAPDVREAGALLGLSDDAGLDDVEAAYRRQALLCHPDKFAHLDPELQALAAAKFVRLVRARDLLAGRASRDSMAR